MKNKILKKIICYIRTNYELLNITNFTDGNSLFNHRCHLNSVQYAITNKCNVILCACIGKDDVFIHFINQNKNGKFVDNTLGIYGKQNYNYYKIKEINPDEYSIIGDILTIAKNTLINCNSNFIQRKLKIIKEDDI